MKMMRKMMALVLAAGMVFTLAMVKYSADGFRDVPVSHYAYQAIQRAVKGGITKGYEDGTFRPAQSVTVAHFSAFLARAFYADEIQNRGGEWYEPYVEVLKAHNIYRDVPLKETNPYGFTMSDPINRYGMASMMYAIMEDLGADLSVNPYEALDKITDSYAISSQRSLTKAVGTCYELGLLNGYEDGTFGGERNMNRAQACAVISRMQDYLAGKTPDREGEVELVIPVQPEKPITTPEDGVKKLKNGKVATPENVKEVLAELEKQYPTGSNDFGTTYYGVFMQTDNETRIFSGGGCIHFAVKMSDEVFGYGTKYVKHRNFDALKPGDIVESEGHWILVIDVNPEEDRFTIADAGTGADAEVQWGYQPMLSVYKEDADYYWIWTRY